MTRTIVSAASASLLLLTTSLEAQNAKPAGAQTTVPVSIRAADMSTGKVVQDSVRSFDTAAVPFFKADTVRSTVPDTIVTTFAAPGPGTGRVVNRLDSVKTWKGLFSGVGIGCELGSFPVFKLWNSSLADSLGDFGLSIAPGSPFVRAPGDTTPLEDSSRLTFTIKDRPNVYNMSFPVSVSLIGFNGPHRIAGSAMFMYFSKTFLASIFAGGDSLLRRVDLNQSLSLLAVSVDFEYGYMLPKRYFSVEGVDRSSLILGASFSPYTYMRRTNDLTTHATDPRMNAVADSIESRFAALSARGYAGALKAGILTTNSISDNSGLEVGLFYTAYWFTHFMSDGRKIFNRDLDKKSVEADKPLSFLTNRFEIRLGLLFGGKRKPPSAAVSEKVSPAPRDTSVTKPGVPENPAAPEAHSDTATAPEQIPPTQAPLLQPPSSGASSGTDTTATDTLQNRSPAPPLPSKPTPTPVKNRKTPPAK